MFIRFFLTFLLISLFNLNSQKVYFNIFTIKWHEHVLFCLIGMYESHWQVLPPSMLLMRLLQGPVWQRLFLLGGRTAILRERWLVWMINEPYYLSRRRRSWCLILFFFVLDWNELFTTKCFGCGFPIGAGDHWVEALNNSYHTQCFKCSVSLSCLPNHLTNFSSG